VVLRKGTKTSSELPVVEIEEEVESTNSSSNGGLLARATQKN